jgi:crossover junction endodeoxyribonuclease RuvC
MRGLRILGIDPGANATGYGVVERDGTRLRHVVHGVLRPARAQGMAARLAEIHAGVAALIARHAPSCVAIEQIFVAASGRSALVLGQARGVALAAIGAAGLPFDELAPQHVKRAVTGNGAAEKGQVQAMVRRLLALEALPPRDAADALAIAICCAHMQGSLLRGAHARAAAVSTERDDTRADGASGGSEARRLWQASAARPRRRTRAARFVLRGAP